MSTQKPDEPHPVQLPLTTQGLREMVFDHILSAMPLFCPPGLPNEVERLRDLLDSMETLMQKVATAAIANRHQLSPLPAFGTTIESDPAKDTGTQRYELRYRMLEQIGNEKPYLDKLLTLDEAVAEYGKDFVEDYWGILGENSPRNIKTPGDRNLWFSTVRYPVNEPVVDQTNKATNSPSA